MGKLGGREGGISHETTEQQDERVEGGRLMWGKNRIGEVEKVEKVTSNVRKRNSGNFGQRCLGGARYQS